MEMYFEEVVLECVDFSSFCFVSITTAWRVLRLRM